jgi:TetR/AcrR family transcriptional regulator
MAATRPRLTAEKRRQAVLDTACRVFAKSSYRGATTAAIARESGVSEPILYRHFPSKRDLYLACLDETWARVRNRWDRVLEETDNPREWVGGIGRAYIELRREEKTLLIDLWIQALNEAHGDPKIRRHVRNQLDEVHRYVVDVIRRSQEAGGVIDDRDPVAEAWIFISLGLLNAIDRRCGSVVGEDLERVFASRRQWMLGDRA